MVENIILAFLSVVFAVIMKKVLYGGVVKIVIVEKKRLNKCELVCRQVLHSLGSFCVVSLNIFKGCCKLVANIIMHFGFHVRVGSIFVIKLGDLF